MQQLNVFQEGQDLPLFNAAKEPTLLEKLIATSSKQHLAMYNGKIVEVPEFKYACWRVRDNMREGIGIVKTPKGEYFEIGRQTITGISNVAKRTTAAALLQQQP